MQREVWEKRANWATALQEYDVEIRLAKIFGGQGFWRMLIGSSNLPEEEHSGHDC